MLLKNPLFYYKVILNKYNTTYYPFMAVLLQDLVLPEFLGQGSRDRHWNRYRSKDRDTAMGRDRDGDRDR